MKKTVILLLTTLILSCASLPIPSETGILVIPTSLENKENLETFGEYRITIVDEDDNEIIQRVKPRNGYEMIHLYPGKYSIKKIEFVYNRSGVNNSTVTKKDIDFTIQAGKIKIIGKSFKTRIYSKGDSLYMNKSLAYCGSKQLTKVKESLEKKENFELWEYN